jgi:hypothetical protein
MREPHNHEAVSSVDARLAAPPPRTSRRRLRPPALPAVPARRARALLVQRARPLPELRGAPDGGASGAPRRLHLARGADTAIRAVVPPLRVSRTASVRAGERGPAGRRARGPREGPAAESRSRLGSETVPWQSSSWRFLSGRDPEIPSGPGGTATLKFQQSAGRPPRALQTTFPRRVKATCFRSTGRSSPLPGGGPCRRASAKHGRSRQLAGTHVPWNPGGTWCGSSRRATVERSPASST